ncbi:MAG TPA: two-component regulator propeller domain-containing protein [Opitutaceae bacterium]|nr:two-component regulator propeller domain-containing protein [Opitutaceae bacterium]
MKIPVSRAGVLIPALFWLAQALVPESARGQGSSGPEILPMVPGKDLRFTVLTGEDGLPSGNMYGVAQDAAGFLWFATDDGLSRYDGRSFRTFRFERGNPNSPSSSSIAAIERGRDNCLWLATSGGGLDRFDPVTETFTHFRHDPQDPRSLGGNRFKQGCLHEDRSGALWIVTVDRGLNRLDPATGAFTHYRHDPRDANSLSSDRIACLHEDRRGALWIGTQDAGLNRLDPGTGNVTRYLPNPGDPQALPNALVYQIFEDSTGLLWVTTREQLAVLDRASGRFTRYAIAPGDPDASRLNSIWHFHEDSAGNLWMGTSGAGVLKLERQQHRVVQYKNAPGDPHSLRNNFISGLHEDPSGTFWVTTLGGGANMFSTRPPKFAHHKHEADDPNSVADNFIFSIFEDRTGIVWVGSSRTLNRWDRQSNTWRVYRDDPTNPHAITTGSVTATQEDPDGTLWFGTYRGGLNRFDPKTQHFKAYRFRGNDPQSLSDDIVRSLLLDSNGVLWVGGWHNGLSRFDRKTETFQRFLHDPDDPTSLGGGSVTDIYEDRAKALWVATENGGVNRFDPTTGKFSRFKYDPQKPTSLANDDVRVLYEDRAGRFWVGTAGGMCLFDRANGTCTVYTEKEGLPNNTIEGILEDDAGNLWISTNNGLSRFDPVNHTFRNYDTSDGLQSNEFHVFTAFCKSPRTGEMYFGGINGFNVFDPRRVVDNPVKPPVVLTDFRLFGKSVPVGGAVLQKNINDTRRLVLPYNQNSLTFEFAALSYVVPAKNQYRYIMEGFDADWRTVGSTERLAVYTGLPAGEYVFRVQGSNEDRVWNEAGTSVAITITPPWWQTWWCRSASALALLGLFMTAYQLRVRSLRQHSRDLERLVAERTKQLATAKEAAEAASRAKSEFLSSMSHELRTPLNAILGYTQILAQQDNLTSRQHQQLDVMHASGEHLLMLINDVLDLSRIEARRLELTEAPFRLSQLLEQAIEITKVKADQKDLSLHFEADPRLPQCVCGDERRVRQILLNLLSNAVKFTRQGSVTLRVRYDQTNAGLLQCEVIDTGVGIASDKLETIFEPFVQLSSDERQGREGVGLGLTITRRLATLMGGTVTVESRVGQGSTFRFSVPLPTATISEAVAEPSLRQIRGYRGPRKQVLAVDDNPTNVGLLVTLLEPLGFEVRTAANGRDALRQVRAHAPDLVLLDLVMPQMDGVETARTMRQIRELDTTRIVGVSATVTSSERKLAFAAVCDGFLGKPIELRELLRTIGRLLQLEWDFAAEEERPPSDDASPATTAVPPPAVLEALRRTVERGEFGELERLLHEQAADPAYAGFRQQVRRLAARYDDDGIAAYLNQQGKAHDGNGNQ